MGIPWRSFGQRHCGIRRKLNSVQTQSRFRHSFLDYAGMPHIFIVPLLKLEDNLNRPELAAFSLMTSAKHQPP